MDDNQKLAFIASMADKALTHVAHSPNIAAPNGGMSHDKMLSFVTAMTKHGLQHMDGGGIAGGISSFLGTNNNFTPTAATLTPGTSAPQLQGAYNQAQDALVAQQGISSALTPGVGAGVNQQANLANIYSSQIAGKGPNPAQAQLNQNTGVNIAQQAALQAGQRGAGASAGAIAENAARQGAATQQQAIGQGATLGAQQQLAAEQNLQNLSGQQVQQGQGAVQGLNNATQNEQNILQGANTAYNNAQVGMQSNINNVNASVASGNQQTAGNIIGGIGQGLSSAAGFVGSLFAEGGMVRMDKGGNVLDASARAHIAPHNFALPGGRYPIHDISHARNALARVSQNGTPEEKKKVKAAVHSKYPSLAGKKMAAGGEVSNDKLQIEHAPMVQSPQTMDMGGIAGQPTNAPQSFVGNWLTSSVDTQGPSIAPAANISTEGANPFKNISAPSLSKPKSQLSDEDINDIAEQAPILSTGASDLSQIGEIPQAGMESSGMMNAAYGGLMKNGGKVKAHDKSEKAKVKGDSLKNDKVPAMLSEGEVVIPRHIMEHPNAPAMAAQFVANELQKRGRK